MEPHNVIALRVTGAFVRVRFVCYVTLDLEMVDLSWFRRRQQTGLRPYDKPARERHILSVVCSCLSVVLLILSLSLQEWGKAENGRCKFTFKLTKVVIVTKDPSESITYGSEWQLIVL